MYTRKGNSNRFMEAEPPAKKTFRPVYAIAAAMALLAVILLAFAMMYNAPLRFSITPDETMASMGAEEIIARELPYLKNLRYMGYSSQDAQTGEAAHMRWYEAQLPGILTMGTDSCALCLARFGNESGRLEEVLVYIGTTKAIEQAVARYDAFFQKDE